MTPHTMPAVAAPRSTRSAWIWLAVLAFLLAVRVPSLVQPAGGDQGLYAYSGQRLLAGDTPYRDMWDQKPPGIVFLYAVLNGVWPHESVVPASDLLAAAGVAALLVLLGYRRFTPAIGFGAATLFLLLGDPYLQRNSGVYVRGQCEPFIALAVTAALFLLAASERRPLKLLLAGCCLGAAFWLKYNAIAYALPLGAAAWAWAPRGGNLRRRLVVDLAWVGAGFALAVAAVLVYFAGRGALLDLYLATITYNLRYSGETYRTTTSLLAYPVTMPFERAHVDMLWYIGAIGALLAIKAVRASRSPIVALTWLVGVGLSILINGGRDLPNYFVQANPALALCGAAGLATLAWQPTWIRWTTAVLMVAGLWRVGAEPGVGPRLGGLPGLVENVRFDAAYALGDTDRATYLNRFKGRKFDALEIDDLAQYLRASAPPGPVYVFGFSGGSACWKSGRVSSSRFFWSRPVTIEFAAGRPGYGSPGLLADLQQRPPSVVVLQKDEWQSRAFFLGHPALRSWLEARYVVVRDSRMFEIWRRK